MNLKNGKAIAWGFGGVGMSLLLLAFFLFKDAFIIHYHLHILKHGSPEDREKAAEKLVAWRAVEVIPYFLDRLQLEADQLEESFKSNGIPNTSIWTSTRAIQLVFDGASATSIDYELYRDYLPDRLIGDEVNFALRAGTQELALIHQFVARLQKTYDSLSGMGLDAIFKLNQLGAGPSKSEHCRNKARSWLRAMIKDRGLKKDQAALIALLSGKKLPPEFRCLAIQCLPDAHPHPREVFPILRESLHDADPGVRMAAVEALAQSGPQAREALPELEILLGDPVHYVQNVAKLAIAKIHGE